MPRADIPPKGPGREGQRAGPQPQRRRALWRLHGAVPRPAADPCQAPPWGYVAGADLRTGKIAYKHRNGTVYDMTPLPLPFKVGVPGIGGPMLTKGGVAFLGAAVDNYLRAYDVTNGKQLWEARLPAGGQATPMTYTVERRTAVRGDGRRRPWLRRHQAGRLCDRLCFAAVEWWRWGAERRDHLSPALCPGSLLSRRASGVLRNQCRFRITVNHHTHLPLRA